MAEARIVTGNTVILEHLPGVYSIYMHMDSMAVFVGQVVPRGAPIGSSGMTGLSTGPHLHWELRVCGVPCDPEAFAGIDNFPEIRRMIPTLEGG
jgi:murein DD-endopeptidase MepM/ murein hydrolase activator NlpD